MNTKDKTILVVDDTESNIDMLLAILKDYDVIPSTSGKDAIGVVENENIDLILLDIMMPEMDGYEVCTILKSKKKTSQIPVIFITAKSDEESIEMAYKVGGIDYVTKPFKPRELLARVRTQLQLREMMADLDYLASRDGMTGIYNRRKFFELSIAQIEQSNQIYGVMIDIDNFKEINDTYGHQVGDEILIGITNSISSNLEEDDIFGRLGGEEFAIIAKRESKDRAVELMEHIKEEISKVEVKSEDGVVVKATVSIGVSEKIEGDNADTLLKRADSALYTAKGEGKNRVRLR